MHFSTEISVYLENGTR